MMKYIVLAIDNMLKFVEAIILPNNKEKSATTFINNNIFSIFVTPSDIISDGGSHFY